MTTRLPRRAFAALTLVALAASTAAAQNPPKQPPPAPKPATHDMSSMAGMNHDMAGMNMTGMPELKPIPKNAIYTKADVEFMQGMIAHHAQAIFMSRLAEARNASPRMVRFTKKIDQSQTAEILLMQEWLRANNQVAPDTSSYHTVMMSGMLTPAQIKELEASRGVDFDAAFLRLMIQHHEGALKMVDDLFASPRAAQDVDVSVFANDVVTVQTAEIGLMRQMLSQIGKP